jgi:hypothetical protein
MIFILHDGHSNPGGFGNHTNLGYRILRRFAAKRDNLMIGWIGDSRSSFYEIIQCG